MFGRKRTPSGTGHLQKLAESVPGKQIRGKVLSSGALFSELIMITCDHQKLQDSSLWKRSGIIGIPEAHRSLLHTLQDGGFLYLLPVGPLFVIHGAPYLLLMGPLTCYPWGPLLVTRGVSYLLLMGGLTCYAWVPYLLPMELRTCYQWGHLLATHGATCYP